MTRSQEQDRRKKDHENQEDINLPMRVNNDPPKTVENNQRDVVGRTNVNPKDVARKVPFDDNDDEDYSEAGAASVNL